MKYIPKYTTEIRTSRRMKKECVAPFIELPDGTNWNIWDIPQKEYTIAVEEALKNAFSLGMRAMQMAIEDIGIPNIK